MVPVVEFRSDGVYLNGRLTCVSLDDPTADDLAWLGEVAALYSPSGRRIGFASPQHVESCQAYLDSSCGDPHD